MRDYAVTKCQLFHHMSDAKLGLLCFGNQYLNEAVMGSLNEINLAWIGATPGVRIDMEAKIASFEVPALGINSQLQLGAMNMIGTQNCHNAAVAALSVVGLDVGLDVEAIGPCIEKLRPPPHRMQIVCKDMHGVTWVDDSKATNVEATYTGLMGLKGQKSMILLGGLAKVVDGHVSNGFEQLIEQYHRCVITFGSSGLLIQRTLSDSGLSIPSIRAENLKDAVSLSAWLGRCQNMINLGIGEVLDAESWGLFYGLQQALKCHTTHIEVETDSAILAKLISQSDVALHPMGSLIRCCKNLIRGFLCFSLKHIYRESNMVADSLAKESINHDYGIIEFDDPPIHASSAYIDDLVPVRPNDRPS